jgi:putative glutamine amidotransferase
MSAGMVPLVGIPCDIFDKGLHPFHGVGEKYINAVAHGAGAMPLLIPGLGAGRDLEPISELLPAERLLDSLDGLFLTGSPSNVQPLHYGGAPSAEGTAHDPQRDDTTLPLIRLAIERGLPLLCVCRGLQELNVVLGGTLHQRVQELPGMLDHREDKQASREQQYADAHEILIEEGGALARLTPLRSVRVNSLHAQGIDRLAPGLRVEARAPDGLIEAVSVQGSAGFALAVQWHPEWRFRENPFNGALLAAFGEAVRSHWRAKSARNTR